MINKTLVHSDPLTEIYHHDIAENIKVIEQHNTNTGEIEYTLKVFFFGKWRTENPVTFYTNIE